jgi:CheY-like chemotaxis protein
LLTLAPHPSAPLLLDTLQLMRRVLPTRIRVEAPGTLPERTLRLDADAVQQALLNLVVNARDAIVDEGVIRIEVVETQRDAQPMLVVAIEDNGIGMTDAVRARATEPFFSTKPAESGTGLGLAMVHGTMERHGGELVLHSTPGQGTRAELWFPVAADDHALVAGDATRDARAVPTSTSSTHSDAMPLARLLLVEDERSVRVATERALQRLGYAVTSASDVASALIVFESGAAVDLVVTDVMMPGGTGVELLHAVRTSGHATPFLLVSGYAVDRLDPILAADPRTALLAKPWTYEALASHVQRMLTVDAMPAD